ncbi:MAG TPA: DoxX family protein [Candidatus Baltobacteraceae bacterium]|nr:DoxX family protein [Candidatus Baltobacteraceae bacterium]
MTAYLIVVVVTALVNMWAAVSDFTRPRWLLASMNRVGVLQSSLIPLGLLKAAGGLGLLVGIVVPIVGLIAAGGLILFFLGAIATHLRARDFSFGYGAPFVFLLLAAASFVLQLDARGRVSYL